MKIKKRTDNLQIVSAMMFFISSLCLIITSFEGPIVEETYQFPDRFINNEIDSAWGGAISKALNAYQINVRYPARSWYGEPFVIQAVFTNRDGSTNSNSGTGSIPPFILDANLDFDAIEAKPGKRILLPIQLPQTAIVQWEITSTYSEMKPGKIWISLLPTIDAKSSIPVLVLPVDIEMRAILGLKIWMWQGIWVGLGIVGIGVFVLKWVRKTRHI